jgi:hypothetical protein
VSFKIMVLSSGLSINQLNPSSDNVIAKSSSGVKFSTKAKTVSSFLEAAVLLRKNTFLEPQRRDGAKLSAKVC